MVDALAAAPAAFLVHPEELEGVLLVVGILFQSSLLGVVVEEHCWVNLY